MFEALLVLVGAVAGGGGDHIGGPYREWRELKNVDLKVGGDGMKAFYDQIVPKVAKEVLKKVGGGKLTTVRIDAIPGGAREAGDVMDRQENPDHKMLSQIGFDITDAMRLKAAGGLPMFSLQHQARSLWWDATNRLQFAPGKWLFIALGRAATPLLTKFGLKAMSPELQHQAIGAISSNAFELERDKAREKKERLREGLTVDGEQR